MNTVDDVAACLMFLILSGVILVFVACGVTDSSILTLIAIVSGPGLFYALRFFLRR